LYVYRNSHVHHYCTDRLAVFNTTLHLTHATPLPRSTSLRLALSVLRTHTTVLSFGPNMDFYTALPADATAPGTSAYAVIDILETLPSGLWSSRVESRYEFTDTDGGLRSVIKAPLGVGLDTRWRVLDQAEAGELIRAGAGEEGKRVLAEEGAERLWLVEEVQITCSRLLAGTVKGQCEGNWNACHGRFLEKLAEERQEGEKGDTVEMGDVAPVVAA
jgi:hypothetical protein